MASTSSLQQSVLADEKWLKLLRRTWVFKHIPFVDFALGSGSLAVGNVTEASDFDVLVAARQRRIFTARFFAILFFGLFGWRRRKGESGIRASDKICLNHFITPTSYRLALPLNPYWELMYRNLVPVYGGERALRLFCEANKLLITEPKRLMTDMRYQYRKSSLLKRSLERLLTGRLGDWFEQKVKAIQIARIEKGLPKLGERRRLHQIAISVAAAKPATYQLEPLIRYNDNELEFHPDPALIEIHPL